ncbi:MAG: ferritin-like domain-containing protein [Rhodospirillaceae bacterium]
MRKTLAARAVAVLRTADARHKADAARALSEDWVAGRIADTGRERPPERPARPQRPELRLPRDMPRRGKAGSATGRIALLHALAHIELNAVDLAADILVRFPDSDLPRAFHDDWVRVLAEEAKHFLLLDDRLRALGAAYGDLPAHDGLWQAARETADDLLARLAIVPLVLEARGLDVTPAMIVNLRKAGDEDSAAVLDIVYRDEIGHVAIGHRWFAHFCERDPVETWRRIVRARFRGGLKPPFNDVARTEAGFGKAFYADIDAP